MFLCLGVVQSASYWFSPICLQSFDKHDSVCKVKQKSEFVPKFNLPIRRRTGSKKNVFYLTSAEGMKAGNYGNLLVQIEQPKGEYGVTIAFLRLITTLVKVTTSSHI